MLLAVLDIDVLPFLLNICFMHQTFQFPFINLTFDLALCTQNRWNIWSSFGLEARHKDFCVFIAFL